MKVLLTTKQLVINGICVHVCALKILYVWIYIITVIIIWSSWCCLQGTAIVRVHKFPCFIMLTNILQYYEVMLSSYYQGIFCFLIRQLLFCCCCWRSAAKRQRIVRSVDVKPVTAGQQSLGGAGVTQASSPSKTSPSTGTASSAVSRQKRPPPLHINGNHTALVWTHWSAAKVIAISIICN